MTQTNPFLNNPFQPTLAHSNIDLDRILDAQRKTAEAFFSAGRVLTEGYQAFLTKQANTATQNVEKAQALAQDFLQAEKPFDKIVEQGAHKVQQQVNRAVNHGREIKDIVDRSSEKAQDILVARMDANLEELARAFAPTRAAPVQTVAVVNPKAGTKSPDLKGSAKSE